MANLRGRFTGWFSPFELQCVFSSAALGVTYSHLQKESVRNSAAEDEDMGDDKDG